MSFVDGFEAPEHLPERLPLDWLDRLILSNGAHREREKGLCVMEAVAWIAGEEHSDKPSCACPVISAFLRDWNDNLPNDAERARLLRPLVPKLVGTKATRKVEGQRAWLAVDWHVRVQAPAWLDLAGLAEHATALRGLAPIVDVATAHASSDALTRAAEASQAAESAARSAAESAAWSAAESAAWSAAESAARSAARSAAESAAWSAAWSAAESAAESAAYARMADKLITLLRAA